MALPPNYRQIATRQARRYGIPPAIFLRQIQQESGFNPNARSSAGAQGIAQFMPATAKQYGVNTADPISSLTGAAHLDADLIKKYGSVERALSAYNSGKPNAYKDPSFAKGQTYNYVRSIMGGQSGAGAVPSAAPAASLNGALSQPQTPPPQQDPGRILQALSNVKGDDYTGFYQQLGQASQQKSQPQVQTQPQRGQASMIPPGSTGIAKTALTQLGTPYQWGGQAKLGSRTDCSGLLQASARANGISLGRTTYQQYKQGSPVALNQLQPGDAVFFHAGPRGPEHVTIYIGGGKVVEDPHTGASVSISELHGRTGVVGARRYG